MRDYQVTLVDLEGWLEGLPEGAAVTSKVYPDLNHLFLPGSGPPSPLEYQEPGNVPVEVVEDIAAWIEGLGSAA